MVAEGTGEELGVRGRPGQAGGSRVGMDMLAKEPLNGFTQGNDQPWNDLSDRTQPVHSTAAVSPLPIGTLLAPGHAWQCSKALLPPVCSLRPCQAMVLDLSTCSLTELLR